jgi:hypothetical protein
MSAPRYHASEVTTVYQDDHGGVLLAGYAGAGQVELVLPAGCVHVRLDMLAALADRMRAVAAGTEAG